MDISLILEQIKNKKDALAVVDSEKGAYRRRSRRALDVGSGAVSTLVMRLLSLVLISVLAGCASGGPLPYRVIDITNAGRPAP